MQYFISTQAIFNIKKEVIAYELFLCENKFNSDKKSFIYEDKSKIIIDTINSIGVNKLTGGKPICIEFNEELIIRETATLLSTTELLIEVSESVEISEEILSKLRFLKSNKFSIVIPYINPSSELTKLYNLADIVKIDYSNDFKSQLNSTKVFTNKEISLLATNINSLENFEDAKNNKISLFMGNFFSEPEIIEVKEVSALKFNYLKLIEKASEEETDFNSIADIISRDVALSYKLLKLVNSVSFGFRTKIENIRQALVALGGNGLRKWVSLLALNEIASNEPVEVIRISLVRAKFLELLANNSSFRNRSQDLFLLGLFSMLDVIMGRPIKEVLQGLNISDDVSNSLILKTGPLYPFYEIILSYENREWEKIRLQNESLKFDNEKIVQSYLEATLWCNEILQDSLYMSN